MSTFLRISSQRAEIMDVFGHSTLPVQHKVSFLSRLVKRYSGNWFVSGPKEQSKTFFSKSCPFKLYRKVLVIVIEELRDRRESKGRH